MMCYFCLSIERSLFHLLKAYFLIRWPKKSGEEINMIQDLARAMWREVSKDPWMAAGLAVVCYWCLSPGSDDNETADSSNSARSTESPCSRKVRASSPGRQLSRPQNKGFYSNPHGRLPTIQEGDEEEAAFPNSKF